MTLQKVRLASVGLGGWGNVLADGVVRCGIAKIIRCFDESESARVAFAEKVGCEATNTLEALLEDPSVEGVLIATPHSTHADLACLAARARKHVFIEKPFTLTVSDAKRAIRAADEAGVILQVGHKRRWFGANRQLREMITRGELGVVHQMEANYSRPTMQTPRSGWRNDPYECPLGGMTGMGIHMVDLLHFFAGPVKRLCAFSRKLLGRSNLDDVTSIILEFESGSLGYVGTSVVTPMNVTVAVFGTEGSAWSTEDGRQLFFQEKGETTRRILPCVPGDGIADELAHFAHCIREGKSPEVGSQEGLETIAVLEAAIESATRGDVVTLSQFREKSPPNN